MSQTGYAYIGGAVFLAAMGMLGFFLTLILFVLHLFSVPENNRNIPWALIELIYDVIEELLLFVASLLLAIKTNETASAAGAQGIVVGSVLGSLHAAYVSYPFRESRISVQIFTLFFSPKITGFWICHIASTWIRYIFAIQ